VTSVREATSPTLIRTPVVGGVPQVPTAMIHPGRLLAVAQSGLLDTDPEIRFDDLLRLACEVADGRRAFFTVVDAHRSFLKGSVGVDVRDGQEARAEDCLSQIIIATDRALVVEDARRDDRTGHLDAVAQLGIGACIGYPVRDEAGHAIGGLCVISDAQRAWSVRQRRALATVARAVSTAVQLRRALTVSRAQVGAMRDARDEQRALARSLQDSLLPPLLPAIPGIGAAAAYLPAGHGVEASATSMTCSRPTDSGGP
jgi:GAF domain-containing protein